MTDPVQERAIRQPSLTDVLIPLSALGLFGRDAFDRLVHVALIARAEPNPESGGTT